MKDNNNNYYEKILEYALKNKQTIANFDITEQEINKHLIDILKIYRIDTKCKNNDQDLDKKHFHFILHKNNNYIYLESYLCPKLLTDPSYLIQNNYWYANIDLNKNQQELNKQTITVEQSDNEKIKLINLLLSIKKKTINVKGIYVYGNFNIGKSFLITAFCNSMALLNNSVIYLVLNRFIIDAKRAINNQDDFIENMIEKMMNVDILVIDEFDQEPYSNFIHNQILYSVLNYRKDQDKLTIFIAKNSLSDLEKSYRNKAKKDAYNSSQFLDRINRIVKHNIYNLNKKQN